MRLFIAISLEGAIKDSLIHLQKHWQLLGMRGHFVPPEKLHLTLAFIGEYGNPDDVMDAISTISFQPFTIQLDGAGNFHDAYWAGITPNESLLVCVRKICRALAEKDILYDRKKFAPHITLVRKGELQLSMDKMLENLPTASMYVSEISLMRSDRGKNGMIYTPISSFYAES
jgi:2'-5' RNA ligase